MSDGLVTRIGKWIDHQWQEKATEGDLEELRELTNHHVVEIKLMIAKMDIGDLKTRMEKIELYSGMTRKVDPTKPPVAKSAFSM